MLSINVLNDFKYEDECCLYWIKTSEMSRIESEGYVGVTTNLKDRIKQHESNLRKYSKYYHKDFRNGFKSGNLELLVIDCGETEDMYYKEFLLRPEKCIGWNYAIGGEIAGTSNLPISIGGVKCSFRKASKIFGVSIHAAKKRNTSYGFSLLESLQAETRVDCGHFCNYPTKTGYKRFLMPISELEEKAGKAVEMYKQEKNCAKIGIAVGLSQDTVQFFVKERLGVVFPDVVTCCYDGTYFSMRTHLSPDDLYHIIDMITRGVCFSDIAVIYSMNKHNVGVIHKVYRKAKGACNAD